MVCRSRIIRVVPLWLRIHLLCIHPSNNARVYIILAFFRIKPHLQCERCGCDQSYRASGRWAFETSPPRDVDPAFDRRCEVGAFADGAAQILYSCIYTGLLSV